MGPLVEAMFVFVGIPALGLAGIASILWGAVVAAGRLTASKPLARPAHVVAFPGGRTSVVRSADQAGLRNAA